MSHTIRWYQIPAKIKKLKKARRDAIHPWKYTNPFYFRHDRKEQRVEHHRKYRHINKIRIDKGMDILIEPRTNGWETW